MSTTTHLEHKSLYFLKLHTCHPVVESYQCRSSFPSQRGERHHHQNCAHTQQRRIHRASEHRKNTLCGQLLLVCVDPRRKTLTKTCFAHHNNTAMHKKRSAPIAETGHCLPPSPPLPPLHAHLNEQNFRIKLLRRFYLLPLSPHHARCSHNCCCCEERHSQSR